MSDGWERDAFDPRPAPVAGRHHSTHEGHGPRCSSNPEIGCVCGLAERQSEEDERQNAPDQRMGR